MTRGGLWKATNGNVVLTFGLAAVPLMLVAGAGIDYSQAMLTRTSLQAAADAASLAAARAAGNNAVRERHGADVFNLQVQQDQRLASLNPAVSVKVDKDVATVTAKAVQPNAFLDLAGFAVNPIGVKAQAATAKRWPVCMLALDQAASPAIALTGNAGINAPNCVVQSNSTAVNSIQMTGSGRGIAEEFCTVGGYTARGNGFTPPPVGNCPKVENPLLNLPLPPVNCAAPYTYCGGYSLNAHASLAIPDNTNVIVQGGTLSIKSHATLSGRNITIHLIGDNAGLDVQGGGNIDIEAPKTGPYAGLAIVQHSTPNPGSSTITGGGTIRIVGTLYLPDQTLNLRGNGQIGAASPAWSMIAARYDLRGTPDIVINSDFAGAGYGGGIVRTTGSVVLVK